jgi:N-acetyl-beta-hexosaminidase
MKSVKYLHKSNSFFSPALKREMNLIISIIKICVISTKSRPIGIGTHEEIRRQWSQRQMRSAGLLNDRFWLVQVR